MAQERKKTAKRMMVDSEDEEEEVINLENPDPSSSSSSSSSSGSGLKRKTEGESGMEKPEKKQATNNPYPWELSKFIEDDKMVIGYYDESSESVSTVFMQYIRAALDRKDVAVMLHSAGLRKSQMELRFNFVNSDQLVNHYADVPHRINKQQRVDMWLLAWRYKYIRTPVLKFIKEDQKEAPVRFHLAAKDHFDPQFLWQDVPQVKRNTWSNPLTYTTSGRLEKLNYIPDDVDTLYQSPEFYREYEQRVVVYVTVDKSWILSNLPNKSEAHYNWAKLDTDDDLKLIAANFLKTSSPVWTIPDEKYLHVITEYQAGKRARGVTGVVIDRQIKLVDDDTAVLLKFYGKVAYSKRLDEIKAIQSKVGKVILEMHPLIKRMLFAKKLYKMDHPLAIRDPIAYRQMVGFISSKYHPR